MAMVNFGGGYGDDYGGGATDEYQWGSGGSDPYNTSTGGANTDLPRPPEPAESSPWPAPSDQRFPAPQPGLTYSGNDPLAWLQSQWGSMAPTSDSLGQLYEALRRGGVNVSRPTRAGGALSDDKLLLNGQMYDFIQDVGGPGARWQTLLDGGGAGGSGGGGAASGPTGPGGMGFDDPSSMLYLQQVMQRLNELNQPQDTSALDQLRQMAMQRIESLNQAPYTEGEEAALVTQYRDPLTLARDSAKRQKAEDLSRRGITPTSGLFHSEMGKIDQAYTRGIAMGSNDLAVRAVNEKQRRAEQQLQILSDMLGVENQAVDRRSGRTQDAVSTAGLFPQFDERRLNMLLGAAGPDNTSSILGNLTSLGQLNQNAQNTQYNQSMDQQAMWGQILSYLLEQM